MIPLSDIQIRSNFYLWLLTGRSNGYVNDSLNTGIDYSVKSTPEEVLYARDFLDLHKREDDVNVLAVLAGSMMTKAMLREMPRNVDATFVEGLLRINPIVSSSPLISRTENSWAYVDGSFAGKLGFNKVTFTRETDELVAITTDNGSREISSATVTRIDAINTRISVQNAQKYGIFADFMVERWDNVDYVTVSLARTRYPYGTTVRRLRGDRSMLRLMNAEGTLAAFEASPTNPAAQVGMAGLAIIRRMLKWVNSEQAGFEVSLDGTKIESRGVTFTSAYVTSDLDAKVDPLNPGGFDA